MKVAVFVEGSGERAPARKESGALAWLWLELLPDAVGQPRPRRIVPISKRNLVAMDPTLPRPPGTLPLDVLIAAELRHEPFDAAVIAWDLQPPWQSQSTPCRWQETLDLYRLLAASEALPRAWRARARQRHLDLETRRRPGARARPPCLREHEILTLCMEPMFESLLLDERGVLDALGLARRPPDWPKSWKHKGLRCPDRDLLQRAILAAQGVPSSKRGRILDQIGGDMKTRKNEWAAFLVERLVRHEATRLRMRKLPLMIRLAELLTPRADD